MFVNTSESRSEMEISVTSQPRCRPPEDLIDHIGVMMLQEKRFYKCADYLNEQYKQRFSKSRRIDYNHWRQWCKTRELWREKIGAWSFDVVEYYGVGREVVWIALSFVDRYIAGKSFDSRMFKLVSLTALYIAIKLSDSRKAVTISSILALSNADYSSEDVISTEIDLLKCLSWNVHPPTPHTFVDDILSMLPHYWDVSPSVINQLAHYCHFIIDLSALDYFFVSHSPSYVALASIALAIDKLDSPEIPIHIREQFLSMVAQILGIDHFTRSFLTTKSRLAHILSNSFNVLKVPTTAGSTLNPPLDTSDSSDSGSSPIHCNEHVDVCVPNESDYYVYRVVSCDAMEIEKETSYIEVKQNQVYNKFASKTDTLIWQRTSSHLQPISPDDGQRP